MAAIELFRRLLGGREHRNALPTGMRGSGDARSADLGALRLGAGREYRGGYDDEAVERFATEDGRASLHDPSVWGENTELRVPHVLNSAAVQQRHLVGLAFRAESLAIEQELETTVPAALRAEQGALDDIEEEEDAKAESVLLGAETRDSELVVPQPGDGRRYLAKLAGLFVGDLAFISVAFQVFGLGDALLLGFIPFSSDLHLAALSSVLALLFLAHHAGDDLVALVHHGRGRGAGGTASEQAELAAQLRPAAWLVGGGLILVGVAAVREIYLAERGIEAFTWVFMAIQAGVFLAALALSMSHAHPLARQWERVHRRVRQAIRGAEESAARHAALVGRVDALLDRRLAVLAMAGQHVRVVEADAPRQVQLYLRRTQLSQPEPVGDRLFPDRLPTLERRSDSSLKNDLIGLAEQPKFERLGVKVVIARREQMREALSDLRRDLDRPPRVWRAETPGAQSAGAEAPRANGHGGP